MEKIEKFLQNYDAGLVLDVATGQGNFLPFIFECKSYERVIAVDMEEQFKEFFAKNYAEKKVEYQVADAYNLPFEDETFDTVTFSNSIHHFENPQKILSEILRVLKSDGKMIINEMYCDNLSEAQKSHKLVHHLSAEQDRILGRFHADTYKKEELIEIIRSSKTKEVEVIDYAYPVENLFDEKTMAYMDRVFDYLRKNTEKNEKLQALQPKIENARKHIKEHGYASAGSIFFVGEK